MLLRRSASENSIRYHRALLRQKVPAALHLDLKGGDGFQNQDQTWRADLMQWFRTQ